MEAGFSSAELSSRGTGHSGRGQLQLGRKDASKLSSSREILERVLAAGSPQGHDAVILCMGADLSFHILPGSPDCYLCLQLTFLGLARSRGYKKSPGRERHCDRLEMAQGRTWQLLM